MAASRRDDSDFLQISGYVSKAVALNFKAHCALTEISQSEALEVALREYLDKQK